MMFDSGSLPFGVVYYDGYCEINFGVILVDTSLGFNKLISRLGKITGIWSRQFSVFVADEDSDWKIPLTPKVDLADVCRDGGAYYFFVMLRRSRRSKKPRVLDSVEFERSMRNLGMEREAFLTSMEVNVESLGSETSDGDDDGGGDAVCEECLEAELTGIDIGFHLCIHDEVIEGFRSTAGPVSRPMKDSDDDGH